MSSALLALLAVPVTAVAAMAAYLLALSAAGLFAAQGTPPPGKRTRRFAILVPAHNEATVIARLLRSLDQQRYPRDRWEVYVVADNCTDDTAQIARRAGAIVHIRDEPDLRAKGHALRWLLQRVRSTATFDAYVVFDADSEVSTDFLDCMDARLGTGSQVIQAHYRVLNPEASGLAALRDAAFASIHYLRPLGRAALGLSCGLKGNGMCFDTRALDPDGWRTVGLAEDVELHLSLVRDGFRVDFAPEAVVRAEMPATFTAAGSQNVRWEAGRLAALRSLAPSLIRQGIVERNPILLDAAVEQFVPPLSVALCVSAAGAVIGAVAGSGPVMGLGVFGIGALLAHVIAGLVAVRAPAHVYRALLGAPAYVVWKMVLYTRAVVLPAGQPWIRTQRPEDPKRGVEQVP